MRGLLIRKARNQSGESREVPSSLRGGLQFSLGHLSIGDGFSLHVQIGGAMQSI